jgi:hypothetical protein
MGSQVILIASLSACLGNFTLIVALLTTTMSQQAIEYRRRSGGHETKGFSDGIIDR